MEKRLSHTEIIDFLKSEKTFLSNEFGVVNIGLFGSFAKGEQTADSDIDILVELKEPRFDWLAGLKIYLEQSFEKKIELVRKSNLLKSRFIRRVEKDIIYV